MSANPFDTSSPWIDRRGARRTVPMKVLVLGFMRTGTASTQRALQILGYHDVHHMRNVIQNPLETELWDEALDAKFYGKGKPYGREEWDQLLGHCQAVTDAPSILFAEELIAAYPDAKVVLTIRDPDKWWTSYDGSLQTILQSPLVPVAAWLDPAYFGRWLRFAARCVATILDLPPGAAAEEAKSKARFVAHYEKVRRLVPKERLLEYRVGEGWERLCAFLGDDIPDVEFPRINDTKEVRANMDEWIWSILRRAAVRWLVPAAVGVAGALYVSHLRA